MKGNIKIISATLLVVAILLFNFSGKAATIGWVKDNETWRYYDKSGNMVTGEWAKDSVGKSYYLDNNGAMAVSTWIDRSYYVDSHGARSENQWRKLKPASGDSFDDYAMEYWYYFGTGGERIENSWKTINDKRYYFNSQGKMHTGWFEQEYFLGGIDDGSMKTGWIKTISHFESEKGVADAEENRHWYYFSKSGELTTGGISGGAEGAVKTIGSHTYAFDKDGKMLSGWVNLSATSKSKKIDDYKYFGSANDGAMKYGWQYIKAPQYVMESSWDEGYNWFYLDKKGIPKKSEKKNKFVKKDLVTIDDKIYLFDEYGRALSGLRHVDGEVYYFGTPEQCYIQTGFIQDIRESNNNTGTFYFIPSGTNKGKGLTGVNEDYLYYKGKLQKAGSKELFKIISMKVSGSNQNYLINTSGLLQKSATVTNGYGVIYKSNSKGILTYIYKEAIKATEQAGDEPNEPHID